MALLASLTIARTISLGTNHPSIEPFFNVTSILPSSHPRSRQAILVCVLARAYLEEGGYYGHARSDSNAPEPHHCNFAADAEKRVF